LPVFFIFPIVISLKQLHHDNILSQMAKSKG